MIWLIIIMMGNQIPINMISNSKFKELLNIRAEKCVSIYIPTYRSGHNQEDNLRFKNALKKAKEQLEESDYNENESLQFLSKGYELLDDKDFWLRLSDGLAVFISKNRFEYFTLPNDVNPYVEVNNEFYLRPLFPSLSGQQRFFLLALSQNEVRFFEGDKDSITPVMIEDLVPTNMKDALALDTSVTGLQSHSGNSGGGTPIFHGNNSEKDNKRQQLEQYFRLINDGLMKMLHDENAPMVLSGVDYLIPIFREVSNYKNIVGSHISGNPEHDDPVLLHEKAWAIINHLNTDKLKLLKEEYLEKISKLQAKHELSGILRAVDAGQVATLFVHKDKKVWGKFDTDTRSMEVHPEKQKDSVDLLELLSKLTYQRGGEVFNVIEEEMPDPKFVANAILRY